MRRRTDSGHWCGYVGVPPGHAAHGIDYQGVHGPEEPYIDVHGGLTWAHDKAGDLDADDTKWWFGFHCHHAWDIAPSFEARARAQGYPTEPDQHYRDRAYVQRQTALLAKQLSRAVVAA